MNSEELELSLRTEFESYLKGFLADLRQEVSEFQRNFETEFEKHKSQTDEAVRRLVGRFEKNVEFDQAFNESVIEHLRLARDEGATITAIAIGEAEKLKEEAAVTAPAEYDKLRDAINEISSKTSQSEILRSLVDHASNFAPRGAFFIVKNEQFVGWRTFGAEAVVDEAAMREIHFPMSADTLLAEAVGALASTAGTAGSHGDDRVFLEALDFGTPDRMYAIPLVARGRGVAVLYADYGNEGITLQPEALETLVRVAGLTVELAAAGVQPSPANQPAAEPEQAHEEQEQFQQAAEPAVEEAPAAEAETTEAVPAYDETPTAEETPSYESEAPSHEEDSLPAEVEAEPEVPVSFDEEPAAFEETVEEISAPAFEERQPEAVEESFQREETPEPVSFEQEQVPVERFGEPETAEPEEEVTYFEPIEEQAAAEPIFAVPETAFEYVPAEEASEEFPEVIEEAATPAVEYAPQPEPAVEVSNGSAAPAVSEPIAEVASAQAARTRYRDRNVDLPIEVPEEERRLHNDARRFARLLVSEIKLYNEQKVTDGRESGDLYDRLREAIDRSRDMYDKRVQQPVADKFDYFHYELVNSLAEGQDVKLGASYPGSKVPA